MRRRLALALAGLLLPLVALADAPSAAPTETPARTLELRLKPLPSEVRKIELEVAPDGCRTFVLERVDGGRERVTPDELAARLDRDTRGRSWLFVIFNITSATGVAWVVLGLLGQVLFTGRMVLQWLVSERRKRSVVPVGFWWMSLGGATMLLVYFSWRRDIVGILGQSTGWSIYVRNLWLIYRERLRVGAQKAQAE